MMHNEHLKSSAHAENGQASTGTVPYQVVFKSISLGSKIRPSGRTLKIVAARQDYAGELERADVSPGITHTIRQRQRRKRKFAKQSRPRLIEAVSTLTVARRLDSLSQSDTKASHARPAP
jgi:hypothetical protein